MSKQSRMEKRRKEVLENIIKIKNPIRNSIILAILIVIFIFTLSFIFISLNKREYLYNINLCSFLGLGISIIWYFVQWGVGEKTMLKLHNKRITQLGKSYKEKIPKSDLKAYRVFRKKKSQLGNLLLFISMLIIMVTTILLQNL